MSERESWRNVGQRIRMVRKENHLTLKQLAKGCDLSPNAISLVERGEVAPTVVTLCKLAHALGVSASSFFQEICSPQVVLTRAQSGASEQPVSQRALCSLAGAVTPRALPQDERSVCSAPGLLAQMVLCVCGMVEYEVDDQVYRLNPGDTLSFNGQAFHRWRNPGTQAGVAVMVLSSDPDSSEAE
jgi:transcriptional regulator with XRE-family HTH domain